MLTTKVWLLSNTPGDEFLAEADLDIDLDIDRDGATIEGYSIYGKSIRLDDIRKHNPFIDKQIDREVYKYLTNVSNDDGDKDEPEDAA